jgi:hypothetical protein
LFSCPRVIAQAIFASKHFVAVAQRKKLGAPHHPLARLTQAGSLGALARSLGCLKPWELED